jgi:hypothetical protein
MTSTTTTEPEALAAAYLIRKGGAYYRPKAEGYTRDRLEAGRFTLEEAISHSHPNGPDGPRDGITYEADNGGFIVSAHAGEVHEDSCDAMQRPRADCTCCPAPAPDRGEVETLARILCKQAGFDPDGGPKVGYGWINYTSNAEEILAAIKPADATPAGEAVQMAVPRGEWYGYDRYVDGKFEAGYLLDRDQEPELREVAKFNCRGLAEPIGRAIAALQSGEGKA